MEAVEASRHGLKVVEVNYNRWKFAEANRSKCCLSEASMEASTGYFHGSFRQKLPRKLPASMEVEVSAEAVETAMEATEASTTSVESSTASMEASITSMEASSTFHGSFHNFHGSFQHFHGSVRPLPWKSWKLLLKWWKLPTTSITKTNNAPAPKWSSSFFATKYCTTGPALRISTAKPTACTAGFELCCTKENFAEQRRVLAPGFGCVPRAEWLSRYSTTVLPNGAHFWFKGVDGLCWLGKISASTTADGVYLVRFLDDPGPSKLAALDTGAV